MVGGQLHGMYIYSGDGARLVEWEKWEILSLSGGWTPSQHLRPSSGREHTVITYSVRSLDD